MSMTLQPLHKLKPKMRKGTRVKERAQIAAAHERRGARVSEMVLLRQFLGAYQRKSHYVVILPVIRRGLMNEFFIPYVPLSHLSPWFRYNPQRMNLLHRRECGVHLRQRRICKGKRALQRGKLQSSKSTVIVPEENVQECTNAGHLTDDIRA